MQMKVCLLGASGFMGKELIAALGRSNSRLSLKDEVVCGIVDKSDPLLGSAIEGVTHPLSADWNDSFGNVNVVLDFSRPEGTDKALQIALQHKAPIVIGTTGHEKEFETKILEAAKVVPVILASNTSVVVTVLRKLAQLATTMLGSEFDVELVEAHHNRKIDAPSGTALTLAADVAEARGQKLENVMHCGRDQSSSKRNPGEIGIQSIRGGDTIGEHTIYFLGDGERLELRQQATKRTAYADGAIRACRWLHERQQKGGTPGMYSMFDVLG